MPNFVVPIIFTVRGVALIEADNLDEACEKAEDISYYHGTDCESVEVDYTRLEETKN